MPKMDDLDYMVVAGHVRRMMVIPAMRRRRLARGYQSRALLRGKPIHGPFRTLPNAGASCSTPCALKPIPGAGLADYGCAPCSMQLLTRGHRLGLPPRDCTVCVGVFGGGGCNG